MIVPSNRVIPITSLDSSQTGSARRQALAMAMAMEFDELRQGQLGIIVTEAAHNIAAHAGSGEIILSGWVHGSIAGIDVLALDRGKGMNDVSLSLQDGHSTAGTPGNGLGAMARLAGIFQIYSLPEGGTAVFARVLQTAQMVESESRPYRMSAISLPITGETVCGDSWSVEFLPERTVYIVADGLGHGPAAAEASQEAMRIFHLEIGRSPTLLMGEIHGALAKTRGAAVSIAEIVHDKKVLNYVGVGNIVAAISSGGGSKSLVSMNGTVGHTIGKVQQFSYPWEGRPALVMHSDGLGTRWSLEQYPGLAARHPGLLAGILYRDFCRKRDDATILVSSI